MIYEHFTNQTLKPLSVHEPTHQMQTYCARKKKHGTVPLINYKGVCGTALATPGPYEDSTWDIQSNISLVLSNTTIIYHS